jgi:arsenate reductase (thioredoxin)
VSHVLFVCVHNAGRSQMSRALFERQAAGRHSADCAGTSPATAIHPNVREAMGELGIDLAGRTPQLLTDNLAERADVIVTMGCGDQCPYIPGKRHVDWDLPDPSGESMAVVRGIRDQISDLVRLLIAELGGQAEVG